MNIGSRSQVRALIKKGLVFADGIPVPKPETQVDENKVRITCRGKEYRYRPMVYYMLNKPSGVVTATWDKHERTVLDLLKEYLQAPEGGGDLAGVPLKDIFPVGRLDKDTLGLLLLTNDGPLAHQLLSPGKHVPKTYLVKTQDPITGEMVSALSAGISMGGGETALPAKVSLLGERECHITITEGKYHQVKRMFRAAGNTLVYLKRLSMGSLRLDDGLEEGQIRELTEKEVAELC